MSEYYDEEEEAEEETVRESWVNRQQPSELDYLRPNGFRLSIRSLPKVTYFCQSANIPYISLGAVSQSTPLTDYYLPGEKINYSDLVVRFMIQEDMSNYIELYDWMMGLGFPVDHAQHRKLGRIRHNHNVGDATRTDAWQYSDASLLVLGSSYNPIMKVNFYDCFPVSLEGLDFDVSSGNHQHFFGSVVFKYRHFDFERLAKET